jgi:hypothetical protein
VTIAIVVAIAWATGSLSTSMNVVFWIVVAFAAIFLTFNLWSGWVEWRKRRDVGS